MSVLVLAGMNRYADPYHDFGATSEALAVIARELDPEVTVSGEVDARLADLAGVDLLVVNVGDPNHLGDHDGTPDAARTGLQRFVADGGTLLVLHASVTSFTDLPWWAETIGGRWERGTTFHPRIGPAAVRVLDHDHSVTRGLADLALHDERYTDLQIDPTVRVLADHEHEGTRHPLVWTHEVGRARVVVDTLGHGPESITDPGHARLLRQAMTWLLAAG